MAAISRQGFDAVFLPLRGFLYAERGRVAALALARRLATFSGLRELPEAGGNPRLRRALKMRRQIAREGWRN
jgi:hypothetical protein